MKNFRQLLEGLPSKKLVFAIGFFQPPTVSHSLLVSGVKMIAEDSNAEYCIYIFSEESSKQPPLEADRRAYYMGRMFPNIEIEITDKSVIDLVKSFAGKYKSVTLVTSSDRAPALKKSLSSIRDFESIDVVPVVDTNPDSDTKIKDSVKTGDFSAFRKLMPKTFTDLDTRRLLNELRQNSNLSPVLEQVKFETSDLREKYHSGNIFNVGDKVTDGTNLFEIVSRGPNYVSVVNESGDISKKWLTAIEPAQVSEEKTIKSRSKRITFKGYTTENLHESSDALKAFKSTITKYNSGKISDPVAVLNALKATDLYVGLHEHIEDAQSELYSAARARARDSLIRINDFDNHSKYWSDYKMPITESSTEGQLTEMNYSLSDKLKVARVIAQALGLEATENISDPEMLIDKALSKISAKSITKDYVATLNKMLQTASETGIRYDKSLVPVHEEVNEDMYTSEYTIKKWVDHDGVTRQRKLRPHRINFKNSKAGGEPETQDVGEFKEDTLERVTGTEDINFPVLNNTPDGLNDSLIAKLTKRRVAKTTYNK